MSGMTRRPPGERAFAALMLLLSAFLLWQAFGISGWQSSTSAGAFPMAAAATMLVCALVIAVQASGARGNPMGRLDSTAAGHDAQTADIDPASEDPDAPDATDATNRHHRIPPVVPATVGAIGLYMLVLEYVGFLPSSLIFLVAMMRLLGERRMLRNLVVSVLALGVIHLVFSTVFAVALPTGTLWRGLGG
jgi:putative tricarboxylic transport membrane protein